MSEKQIEAVKAVAAVVAGFLVSAHVVTPGVANTIDGILVAVIAAGAAAFIHPAKFRSQPPPPAVASPAPPVK